MNVATFVFWNSSGAAEAVFKRSRCAGQFLSRHAIGAPRVLVYKYLNAPCSDFCWSACVEAAAAFEGASYG